MSNYIALVQYWVLESAPAVTTIGCRGDRLKTMLYATGIIAFIWGLCVQLGIKPGICALKRREGNFIKNQRSSYLTIKLTNETDD